MLLHFGQVISARCIVAPDETTGKKKMYPQNEGVVNYKIANYFLVNLLLNNFRHQLQAPLGSIKP